MTELQAEDTGNDVEELLRRADMLLNEVFPNTPLHIVEAAANHSAIGRWRDGSVLLRRALRQIERARKTDPKLPCAKRGPEWYEVNDPEDEHG